MNAIFNWLCGNRLSLNASKTHYMVINLPHKNLDLSAHSLKIYNVILSKVTSCKFLGITLDESLSWRKQLSSINSKISKALFVIKQVELSLPIERLHTLYFSCSIRIQHTEFLHGEMPKITCCKKHKLFKNEP